MERKRLGKIIAYVLSIVLLFSAITLPARTEASFETNAYNSILLDADTGKILYQKNIDVLLPIASMSKMMSEYLILEAVNSGKINWDQTVPVSEHVRKISHDRRLSNVYLRTDEQYTVKELYESVAIYSANGATMALAELISGSEQAFVKLMNETATQIGMGVESQDFKFVNSTGLPNQYLLGKHPVGTVDDENLMTARATATLAFRLVNDFPEVLDTASIPRKMFKDGTSDAIQMDNWNWMLPELVYGYEYVDGLKTGHTNAAGYCFTGTAKKDGTRVISVVMKTDSPEERFNETRRLMEYGFNSFSKHEILPAGYTLEGSETLPVIKGKQKEVAVATSEALSVMMKNGEDDLYTIDLALDESLLNEEGKLIAPIEKGQKVGTLSLQYKGDTNYEFIVEDAVVNEQVDIIVTETVDKAGWFTLTMRAIGGFFGGVWTSVANGIKGLFS